ncbi:MAG: ABC transporter substrate-binding protein [Ignavibacteriales bacterium]|nr:ABC transporter substrate-binding protein [Ignavibacteriales bacterium]
MKYLVRLALFGLISLSCSRDEQKENGRVEIVFWHSFVAATIPALDELIGMFEHEHPAIQIKAEYIPTGDALVQKLIAAVQSNTAPDISWIHADFLDKLVEADAIYPMADFMNGPDGLGVEDVRDIVPASLEAGRWRGQQFALPMEATSLALFYNRDLFRKAGLSPERPPRTWEELHAFARQLTVDNDGDGKIDQYGFFVPVFPSSGPLNIWMNLQWAPFLWQAGGDELSADGSRVLFDGPAGIAALVFWKKLYSDLDFRSFGLSHDMGFASGKLGMILDGPWDLPKFRELKNIDWMVAPLPSGPGGKATYIAGEQLAIFRQSRHPREAWTFVRWVLEPRVQASFSRSSGYLPVRKSVLRLEPYREFLRRDSVMRVFVDQMNVGRARRAPDRYRVEINRFLAEAIERATLGNEDPSKVLGEAAAKANAVLAR